MNKINSEVYVDLSIIFNMMPKEMKNKINPKFIHFIEENKSKTYISNINQNISLEQQKIRKETKEMLGIIYRDYLCDEEERKELLKEEKEEIIKLEEEKREKYNPNNIFSKEEVINLEEKNVSSETQMIEYKKSLFDRFIQFIKKIMHR